MLQHPTARLIYAMFLGIYTGGTATLTIILLITLFTDQMSWVRNVATVLLLFGSVLFLIPTMVTLVATDWRRTTPPETATTTPE